MTFCVLFSTKIGATRRFDWHHWVLALRQVQSHSATYLPNVGRRGAAARARSLNATALSDGREPPMPGPLVFPRSNPQLLCGIELFTYYPTIATIIAPLAHRSSATL